MSRNEKYTLVISAIALLVSIASPFINYHYFDTNGKAYKQRGILEVVGEEYTSFRENDDPKGSGFLKIRVKNIGKLPIDEIRATAVFVGQDTDVSEVIKIYPEVPTIVIRNENVIFYEYDFSLPPNKTFEVIISNYLTGEDRCSLLGVQQIEAVSLRSVRLTTSHGDLLTIHEGRSSSCFSGGGGF